ncbi:MAG TPA: acyltransferase [Solirubrobacteraceae bacterium]|nr:acyltransferase [Solirubrobacteraceae bacterium]
MADLKAQLVRRRRDILRRIRGQPTDAWMVRRGLTLGTGAYINETATVDPDFLWLIFVDDEAVVADHAHIIAHDASTRHFTGYTRIARVHIGKRAYIGAGAIILPGVTIGDGAVVGAGSVVRRDVDPGTIVVGNPAQAVGTADDFAARHRARQAVRPSYPSHGFSGYGSVSSENMDRVRRELADGSGYVGYPQRQAPPGR